MPTILRTWRGKIRTADTAEYVAYILGTGLSDYAETPGNLGYQMVTRDLGDGTCEVATMSWWTGMDAVRGFAGDDPERARYYPEDDRFLVERPEFVEHSIVEAARVTVEVYPFWSPAKMTACGTVWGTVSIRHGPDRARRASKEALRASGLLPSQENGFAKSYLLSYSMPFVIEFP